MGPMRIRVSRFLVAALLLAALAGSPTARAAALPALESGLPHTTLGRSAEAEAPWLSLAAFAQTYDLRLASSPSAGRVQLRGRDLTLALAPGLRVVSVNGRARRLARAPRVHNGRLSLPREIVSLLPARLRTARVRGTVVLDPGHGGRDAGAVANGLKEKDLVLDVARRAARRLRAAGATVILTRNSDCFVSLSERSRIANRTPGAVFVSIHANALSRRTRQWRSVHGVETFVLARGISESYRVRKASQDYNVEQATDHGVETLTPAEERAAIAELSRDARAGSLALARAVQGELVGQTEDADRKVKQMNLAVLRETYFGPAVLTEIGFLTHPPTAKKMKTSAFRDRVAQAIADGIAAFLRER